MARRTVLFLGLIVFAFFANGCNTICKGSKGAAQGISEGAKEDWEAVNKADTDFRKNYW